MIKLNGGYADLFGDDASFMQLLRYLSIKKTMVRNQSLILITMDTISRFLLNRIGTDFGIWRLVIQDSNLVLTLLPPMPEMLPKKLWLNYLAEKPLRQIDEIKHKGWAVFFFMYTCEP